MTTHEFAKQLLELPELPIVVPRVVEYEDDPDDSIAEPKIAVVDGEDNGAPCKVALITYTDELERLP